MGKKILIVDDDPVIRMLVTDIVSSFGHSVESSENGKDCLVRLTEGLPDIIFLDLQMPGMNGMEVLKQIRNDARTASVPVVMLSANSEVQSLGASDCQPDFYISKPFALADFLKVLNP